MGATEQRDCNRGPHEVDLMAKQHMKESCAVGSEEIRWAGYCFLHPRARKVRYVLSLPMR